MKRAIFLDRDGVICENRGLVYKKEELILLPRVLDALKVLKCKGYLLIVVTNQPQVARGLVTEDGIKKFHEEINKSLKGIIDQFYFCPHHPEMHPDVLEQAKKYRVNCNCRKPQPGMLLQAAREFNLNLNESWMIGDMITDILAGKSAGCKTILVKSPDNNKIIVSSTNLDKEAKPDKYAKSLYDSIKFII